MIGIVLFIVFKLLKLVKECCDELKTVEDTEKCRIRVRKKVQQKGEYQQMLTVLYCMFLVKKIKQLYGILTSLIRDLDERFPNNLIYKLTVLGVFYLFIK